MVDSKSTDKLQLLTKLVEQLAKLPADIPLAGKLAKLKKVTLKWETVYEEGVVELSLPIVEVEFYE